MSLLRVLNPHSRCLYGIRCYVQLTTQPLSLADRALAWYFVSSCAASDAVSEVVRYSNLFCSVLSLHSLFFLQYIIVLQVMLCQKLFVILICSVPFFLCFLFSFYNTLLCCKWCCVRGCSLFCSLLFHSFFAFSFLSTTHYCCASDAVSEVVRYSNLFCSVLSLHLFCSVLFFLCFPFSLSTHYSEHTFCRCTVWFSEILLL